MDGVSNHNKNKIVQFQRSCQAQGLSYARMLRYLTDLPVIASKLKKDFEAAKKKDIEAIIADIESTDLAPNTKLSYAVTLKKFYKWLYETDDYPKCVSWIKTTGKKNNNKLPEEILKEEEVKSMIQNAGNSRNRALISLLWESGCRISELLLMKIKNVSFEKELTRITINGKTGPRRIPLIDSTPFLAEWIENHPLKNDPNSPLWIMTGNINHHKPLTYAACRKMINETAKKAGIKKATNPHAFRHARATFLANHLKEAQMDKYFGWTQGSDIPKVYVHLCGRDIDDAILEMRGLKPREESKETTLAPKQCPRCNTINKATGKFCIRCGAALDLKTAMSIKETTDKIDNYMAKILEDEDVKNLIRKKLKDMV